MASRKTLFVLIMAVIIVLSFVYFLEGFLSKSASEYVVTVKQTPYLKEYSIPSGSFPNALLVDKEGTVWIATSKKTLLSLDPRTETMKTYKISSGDAENEISTGNSTMVWTLVQDNESNIWFSQLGTNSLWRFDTRSGNFEMIPLENGSAFQMKVGNNGDIWFTTLSGNTLGLIEKSTNEKLGYKINSIATGSNTNPAGLYLINDSLWVANERGGNIAHFTINQENGIVKRVFPTYKIPPKNESIFFSPTDLVVNKDIIWLTEHETSFLTEYNMSTGQIHRYPTSQSPYHVTTLPFWIRASNASEILWFNEHQGNKIAFFEPRDKSLVEYNIPSLPRDGYLTYPLNIALDPHNDRILWFSEWNTDKVGVIDGYTKIPFEISADSKKVRLDPGSPENSVDLRITGSSPYNSNRVIMNVSSSILSTAELGNLTAEFSSNLVDLSSTNEVKLLIRDNGVSPGNYTLGISASDGYVTKTIFLDLSILSE